MNSIFAVLLTVTASTNLTDTAIIAAIVAAVGSIIVRFIDRRFDRKGKWEEQIWTDATSIRKELQQQLEVLRAEFDRYRKEREDFESALKASADKAQNDYYRTQSELIKERVAHVKEIEKLLREASVKDHNYEMLLLRVERLERQRAICSITCVHDATCELITKEIS